MCSSWIIELHFKATIFLQFLLDLLREHLLSDPPTWPCTPYFSTNSVSSSRAAPVNLVQINRPIEFSFPKCRKIEKSILVWFFLVSSLNRDFCAKPVPICLGFKQLGGRFTNGGGPKRLVVFDEVKCWAAIYLLVITSQDGVWLISSRKVGEQDPNIVCAVRSSILRFVCEITWLSFPKSVMVNMWFKQTNNRDWRLQLCRDRRIPSLVRTVAGR